MEAWLRCTLFPGQFSSELAVVVQSATGRDLSLFAQKTELKYDELPDDNRPVDGWIKVLVLQCDQNRCLVRLPQTTLENGQFITVLISRLDRIPTGPFPGFADDPLEPGSVRCS